MSSDLPSRYVEVQVIITPSAHSIDVVRPQEPKSLPEGRYLLVPVEGADRLVDREAINYEAAEAILRKFPQEQAYGGSLGWGATVKEIVDAALGVTDE